MTEPDLDLEASVIVAELAECLEPIELIGLNMPEDIIIQAAVQHFEVMMAEAGEVDQVALSLAKLAAVAVIMVRRLSLGITDGVIEAAEAFLREEMQ